MRDEKFMKKIYQKKYDKFKRDLVFDDKKTLPQIAMILEDAIYYKVRSEAIDEYINQAKSLIYSNEVDSKRHEKITLKRIAELEKLTVYKFLMFGGAMLDHITIYHYSNADAWADVAERIAERGGAYYSAIAYFDNDINPALKQLEKFFIKPAIKKSVRGATVYDMVKDYKQEPCSCRERKLAKIINKNS